MTLEQPLVANPVERLPARAPVQPRVPEPSNEPIELLETAIVRRSPVVLVVAPEFGIERRGLMLDRVVPMLLAPLRHRLHTADRKSTRLNSSHSQISYAVFCLKKKNKYLRKS